jgi:hypothetical protein
MRHRCRYFGAPDGQSDGLRWGLSHSHLHILKELIERDVLRGFAAALYEDIAQLFGQGATRHADSRMQDEAVLLHFDKELASLAQAEMLEKGLGEGDLIFSADC